MPYKTGDTVWIKAEVVQAHNPGRGPEWESYDLKLTDGQQLQTNIKNLAADDEDEDEDDDA